MWPLTMINLTGFCALVVGCYVIAVALCSKDAEKRRKTVFKPLRHYGIVVGCERDNGDLLIKSEHYAALTYYQNKGYICTGVEHDHTSIFSATYVILSRLHKEDKG